MPSASLTKLNGLAIASSNVLNTIQTEAAIRVEEAKRYAVRQVEETRKAAATASWWLFFTASVSAIASATAGALGVIVAPQWV